MRLFGALFALIGLVAAVVGVFSGCNSLFAWNGRHAVYTHALAEGRSTHEVQAVGGRRYTIGVRVVFDREGLETREGNVAVESELPLVVRAHDAAGTTLAEMKGWLDPNKPPNVLYGASPRPDQPLSELVVERIVGSFGAATTAPIAVDVDLGADRVGSAHILERRLEVFDDAMPAGIRNAFIVAGVGAGAFVLGLVLSVVGWFKRRRPRKGLRPRPDVV